MKPTVMICAGGTGGHMFPALSLAEDLKSRDCRVVFMVDQRAAHYTEDYQDIDVHAAFIFLVGRDIVEDSL